eukprot:4263381-Amphidinium_carterae.1
MEAEAHTSVSRRLWSNASDRASCFCHKASLMDVRHPQEAERSNEGCSRMFRAVHAHTHTQDIDEQF